jgi:hypothetical protein
MGLTFKNRISFFFKKAFNYEFWPYWIFYFPMYFYGLFLALKARSFIYFSTAKPGQKYGGVMGESKYKVLSLIPEIFRPRTVFLPRSSSYSCILNIIEEMAFEYPFIIKPDVGERGKDVEKINNESELKAYLTHKTNELIIQEYVDHELELGILYYRFPKNRKGQITSVVQKDFLTVTGDGKRNLQELISTQLRANGRLEYLHNKFKNQLGDILEEGEKLYLEPIGNHCRGTTFYDAQHLINNRLRQVFDTISLEIDGYYYGRFDIKVPSLDDLYAGKNIKILELNGVSSEVAHIYDPKYKLIQAYKDVAANMKIIAKIAKVNHELGVRYDPLWKFLKDLRSHFKK